MESEVQQTISQNIPMYIESDIPKQYIDHCVNLVKGDIEQFKRSFIYGKHVGPMNSCDKTLVLTWIDREKNMINMQQLEKKTDSRIGNIYSISVKSKLFDKPPDNIANPNVPNKWLERCIKIVDGDMRKFMNDINKYGPCTIDVDNTLIDIYVDDGMLIFQPLINQRIYYGIPSNSDVFKQNDTILPVQ